MSEHLETIPDPEEARRQRLRERGWQPAPGTLFSRKWRSPGGRVLSEEEAFADLERAEAKEKSDG